MEEKNSKFSTTLTANKLFIREKIKINNNKEKKLDYLCK